MNLRQALSKARGILAHSGIEDASLEGEILLRHVTGMSRAQLHADLDRELSTEHEKTLSQLMELRRRGEPSAYITGHREFYGLDFRVDYNVLIPRPETELLVDKAIELAKANAMLRMADIGTGCGAIAVSLAVHMPQATVYAIDISPAALEIARANCQRHGVADRVVLLCGDLLEPLDEPADMIVANLPYVKKADLQKNASLSYEPALALNGGKDGLDRIRRMCRQAKNNLNKGGFLLMEIGEGQAKTVVDILCKAFPGACLEVRKDFAGIERVVSLRLT